MKKDINSAKLHKQLLKALLKSNSENTNNTKSQSIEMIN